MIHPEDLKAKAHAVVQAAIDTAITRGQEIGLQVAATATPAVGPGSSDA